MRTFFRSFQLTPKTSVLDVGGLPRSWNGLPVDPQTTIVNLEPLPPHEAHFLTPNQKFVQGNGTRLAWEDKSFEIVFSNSVIEHLGTRENQVAFAGECRRVGMGYWIQTPAREFPVEPHYLTLFLHWFPRSLQKRLLRWCSVWGWLSRPQPGAVDAAIAEVRLLTFKEVKGLFPDAKIIIERWLGLPKSYIAYKPLPSTGLSANRKP